MLTINQDSAAEIIILLWLLSGVPAAAGCSRRSWLIAARELTITGERRPILSIHADAPCPHPNGQPDPAAVREAALRTVIGYPGGRARPLGLL